MIPCTTTTLGRAINYCGDDSYATATLKVGQLVSGTPDVLVAVENLATGRTSFHTNSGVSPLVEIDLPSGLAPGQMYRVSIEVDGAEVMWRPYVHSGTVYSIGTVEVSAVHVNTRKEVDNDGNIIGTQDQWISV